MALHQCARVSGIGLKVQDARGVRVHDRIVDHLLERRQADHAARTVGALHTTDEAHHRLVGCGGFRRGSRRRRAGATVVVHRVGIDRRVDRPRGVEMRRVDLDPTLRHRATHERRAAQVGDVADGLARREAVCDLDDLPLTVAVDEQVGLGIEQHRTTHLLRPIVEVGDTPQAGLDAADDDRYTGERLARTLRIDDHRAVGPQSALTARRVGIIAADAPIARIAVDHRVHVAGGDAEEEVRFAEHAERVGALPVRLRDDADPEALRLEQAPDDRHAEARMVDVGVAGDDDDVAGVPAERVHLGARHG